MSCKILQVIFPLFPMSSRCWKLSHDQIQSITLMTDRNVSRLYCSIWTVFILSQVWNYFSLWRVNSDLTFSSQFNQIFFHFDFGLSNSIEIPPLSQKLFESEFEMTVFTMILGSGLLKMFHLPWQKPVPSRSQRQFFFGFNEKSFTHVENSLDGLIHDGRINEWIPQGGFFGNKSLTSWNAEKGRSLTYSKRISNPRVVHAYQILFFWDRSCQSNISMLRIVCEEESRNSNFCLYFFQQTLFTLY